MPAGYLLIVINNSSKFATSRNYKLKASLLYQHELFYREVSLQVSYYNVVKAYDRDWPTLKN